MEAAKEYAALLTDRLRPKGARFQGYVALAQLEVAQGSWRRAAQWYRAAESIDSVTAVERQAATAAVPFSTVSDAALRALRSRIASWRLGVVGIVGSGNAQRDAEMQSVVQTYLVGFLSNRLRDSAGVARAHRQLAALRLNDEGLKTLVRIQLRTLDAMRLALVGDSAAALKLLDAEDRFVSVAAEPEAAPQPRLHERFLRAQLLEATGRHREADGFYSSIGEQALSSLVFAAPAHYQRALIQERLGRQDLSSAEFENFLRLWRTSDTEARHMVQRASDLLAARRPRL